MIDREVLKEEGKMKAHFDENDLVLKVLDKSYIQQMMSLQHEVIMNIGNPELFVPSSEEEFEEAIQGKGCIMGYTTKKGELVAMGVYMSYGYDTHNYGYDIDLTGEALLEVGQIEATIVAVNYRGLGLQRKLCTALEEEARKRGNKLLCATASPLNEYSVRNFLKLGYTIKKEKLKYGGLRRYVLEKIL